MCSCIEVIHQRVSKARKDYHDDGWEEISEWINGGMWLPKNEKVPFAEKRKIVLIRKNKPYRIQKGQEYKMQFNKREGDVYIFRTKKILWDLMVKYDLFGEC